MGQEISFISLVTNATFFAQLILILLAVFSVISWAIIFSKWTSLAKAKRETKEFMRQYKSSTSIASLYTALSGKSNQVAVGALFFNGINEYNKMTKQGINQKEIIIENLERTLASSMDAEIDSYEDSLSLLATFGSVSPYIGLLGTVWGIMHAFIGLGNTGQATLATVAPGIAEALIATAVGLFVAIPAYIFYNKFSADVNHLTNSMNKFGDDFLNLINRRLSSNNANKEEI